MSARLSLQRVLRQGLDTYSRHHLLSAHQWQVCHHILRCRTPQLGGVHLHCDHCDNSPVIYHACRDRHCPRCQRQATEDWCERQKSQVLPVTYHHLVFTLPHDLNDWVERHPALIYRLLFHSAWATLSTFGQDPKRLNGQMGITAVLHTWGQTLVRHVHLHVLAPGGALGADGQWHGAKHPRYLFPVRALSRHFRGGFVSRLRQALEQPNCLPREDPQQSRALLATLMQKDWVVYSKPALQRAEDLIDYLGRYTHKIALSDSRLHSGANGEVLLHYKDYRDQRKKLMALNPQELIRRYLQHVLPKGFMRVRHYGFLANCCRAKKLPLIRQAIDRVTEATRESAPDTSAATSRALGMPTPEPPTAPPGYPCKKCRRGRLRIIETLPPQRDDGG